MKSPHLQLEKGMIYKLLSTSVEVTNLIIKLVSQEAPYFTG